jgi:hypothetical protein
VPFQLDAPNSSGVPFMAMVARTRTGKVAINRWNSTSRLLCHRRGVKLQHLSETQTILQGPPIVRLPQLPQFIAPNAA